MAFAEQAQLPFDPLFLDLQGPDGECARIGLEATQSPFTHMELCES